MATYQHGAACFPSKSSANSAAAANEVGKIIQTANGPAVVDLIELSDNSITYAIRDLTTSQSTISTVTVNPPECQLMSLDDGLSIGWQIAAVWAAAFALKFLAKYIWLEMTTNDGSNYGNT